MKKEISLFCIILICIITIIIMLKVDANNISLMEYNSTNSESVEGAAASLKAPETTQPQTIILTPEVTLTPETTIIIPETTIVEATTQAPETAPPQTFYTKEDVIALAKTIQGEAGNVKDKKQQAAVAWCVLNRYDSWKNMYKYNSIVEVCEAKNQFLGYWLIYGEPRQDMIDLAEDVLMRWSLEKQGFTNVGRTLPSNYYYFWGDGRENHFRIKNSDYVYWDWSYEDPYTIS